MVWAAGVHVNFWRTQVLRNLGIDWIANLSTTDAWKDVEQSTAFFPARVVQRRKVWQITGTSFVHFGPSNVWSQGQ